MYICTSAWLCRANPGGPATPATPVSAPTSIQLLGRICIMYTTSRRNQDTIMSLNFPYRRFFRKQDRRKHSPEQRYQQQPTTQSPQHLFCQLPWYNTLGVYEVRISRKRIST